MRRDCVRHRESTREDFFALIVRRQLAYGDNHRAVHVWEEAAPPHRPEAFCSGDLSHCMDDVPVPSPEGTENEGL